MIRRLSHRLFTSTAKPNKYIYHSEEFNSKLKFNPVTQKKLFDEEFAEKTPFWNKYCKPFNDLGYSGYRIGWFNVDRDSELGAGRWNCNGVYPNKLASVLFRSKILQTKWLMNLYVRLFDRKFVENFNLAEPQPRISTNSVFLYKDNSDYFVNRRGLERLLIFFFLAQGLNFTGVLLYVYIGWYFALIVSKDY